ncbi:hypothetical protein M1512_04090 [Patescibacteria group bacterium]|jgi:hypothetical protein|nr:hypothetical protein [Patescibacteria group bacterium]
MKRKNHTYIYVVATTVAIAMVLTGSLLYRHYNNKPNINSKVIKTIKSSPKTSSSPNNPKTSANTSGSANNGSSSISTDNSANSSSGHANLIAPSGIFVSNHNPDLSGYPYPSEEASTCNTSPGASCYIKFVGPNGQVKSLPTQTTNSSGSTSWTWDVYSSGFTVGKWQITAVVSLDGTTKTTTDSMDLNVQQ